MEKLIKLSKMDSADKIEIVTCTHRELKIWAIK